MLIDTNPTLAYKCSSCGTYAYFKIPMFKLSHKKQYCFTCGCKGTNIKIYDETATQYKIEIGCIGCGGEHTYIISRMELLHKDIKVFCCPETNMQLCFAGNDSEIRKKIDSIEREMDEIINEFGYESYFRNSQVMLDSLNKIHDIAEQRKLLCECGNIDIELVLLSDRIHLSCKKCPANKTIMASSNEDLRETLLRNRIFLTNPILQIAGTKRRNALKE